MNEPRWRKALVASLSTHIVLLAVAGFLPGGAAPTPVEEVLLEMDLASALPANAEASPHLTEAHSVSPVVPTPQSTPVLPAVPDDPFPAEQVKSVSKPVVSASSLTMTEVATAVPASGQIAAGENTSTSAPAATQNSGTARSSISAPAILAKQDPDYPTNTRKAGQEGTVVLRIHIQTNGLPGEITIAASSGYPELDDAAVTAVRKWRFVPAKETSTGKAVACTTNLPVSFRLHH